MTADIGLVKLDPAAMEASAAEAEAFLRSLATRREGTTIRYRIASDRIRPILAELYRLFCAPEARV